MKDHDKKVTIDAVSPTCTKQGATAGKKCSVCGKITQEQETVEALGHDLGKYEITDAPTCTAKGEETAKCTRCSYTKTRDVDYYTLELSFDNRWVYGKTTADSHMNFGEAESGDLDTFVDWVFSNNKHIIATSRHTTASGTVS